MDKGARELLVAVSFGLAASEAVADRRSSSQMKRWEAFARLYKKVTFGSLITCHFRIIWLLLASPVLNWLITLCLLA